MPSLLFHMIVISQIRIALMELWIFVKKNRSRKVIFFSLKLNLMRRMIILNCVCWKVGIGLEGFGAGNNDLVKRFGLIDVGIDGLGVRMNNMGMMLVVGKFGGDKGMSVGYEAKGVGLE